MRRFFIVYAVAYLNSNCGINEVGRSNLYSGGSGHQELDGVFGSHDTAKANHGNLDCTGYLPYHPHGHGLHGRTAQSASTDAQPRTAFLDIYRHAHQRID